ncbi:MAG: hypothetical protein IPM54_31185 [Polyangiaceae bacterium]|nr:hypothetical protein [Polyangiaceae bacterium]
MKTVLHDWANSLTNLRKRRANQPQELLPMGAVVVEEMAEPVVLMVDKAAWDAMVDKVVLLGKAVQEALVAKAVVVVKRAPRAKLLRGEWE